MANRASKSKTEVPRVKDLTKGWNNKDKFLSDLVSTDHKLYCSAIGGSESIDMLGKVIVVTHQLPGYFMCVVNDFASPKPFLHIKKGGETFMLEGLRKIVAYISAVARATEKHGTDMEDVKNLSRMLGGTDPAFSEINLDRITQEDPFPPKK